MLAATEGTSPSSGSAPGGLAPSTSLGSRASHDSTSRRALRASAGQEQLSLPSDSPSHSNRLLISYNTQGLAHDLASPSGATASPTSTSARSSLSQRYPHDSHQTRCKATHEQVWQQHAAAVAHSSMALIPEARPDNDYLGFCRSAFDLQNGYRDEALQKAKEGGAYSRSGSSKKHTDAYYQKCREPKCAFRSNVVSSDPNLLWSKVFEYPERGIKLRWTFLAKSHVPQRVVMHGKLSYKCIFCVYQSVAEAAVFSGEDAYLHHIGTEHRGKEMDPVVLHKTRCLNNLIANDRDDFDINLWPSTASKESLKVSEWLPDEHLEGGARQRQGTIDSVNSYYLSGIKTTEPEEDTDSGAEESKDDANVAFAAGSDHFFAPTPHYPHVDLTHNPLAPQGEGRGTWNEFDANPWAESSSPRAIAKPQQLHARIESQNTPEVSESWSQSPTDMRLHVPEVPKPVRKESPVQLQTMQQASSNTSLPNTGGETVTSCLNDIVQIYDDALTILHDLVQQAAQSLRPAPLQHLQYAVSDAPPEIEKWRQRGMAAFGPSFDIAEDTAYNTLQRMSRQLHSGLFRPLSHACKDYTFSEYGPIVQAGECGQQSVVAFLKHRIAAFDAMGSRNTSVAGLSPQSLQPLMPEYTSHRPSRPRASSQEVPSPGRLSNDAHSEAGSARQPSTSSSSSHQPVPPSGAVESRKRSSVFNLFKPSSRSGHQEAQNTDGKAEMKRLDLRSRKHGEESYHGVQKPVELDSTPVLRR